MHLLLKPALCLPLLVCLDNVCNKVKHWYNIVNVCIAVYYMKCTSINSKANKICKTFTECKNIFYNPNKYGAFQIQTLIKIVTGLIRRLQQTYRLFSWNNCSALTCSHKEFTVCGVKSFLKSTPAELWLYHGEQPRKVSADVILL